VLSSGAVGDDPRSILLAKLRHQDELSDRFVAHLRAGHEDAVAAIVCYGSLLSSLTRTPTSYHDFYVIVDSLRGYHARWRDRVVGGVLPPLIYYRTFDDGLRCKYCVLTRMQLAREMGPPVRDLHNVGRFSKRVGVVWTRDDAAFEEVVAACLHAARTLVPHALALLGARFTLDQFIRMLLSLSYLGEERVAEEAKVDALFAAERDHYRRFYRALLAESGLHPIAAETYERPAAPLKERRATERLLARSRLRGQLRWPKYMVTVDNWLEVALDKVERHHGVRVELSERERRWPLIFGWPKFLALRRRGVVK